MFFATNRTRKIVFVCGILLCALLCGMYTLGYTVNKHAEFSNWEAQQSPRVGKVLCELITESLTPRATRDPIETKCPMYQEFRYLDFLHPILRHKLCRNVEAYRRYPDGFPMCQLPSTFNEDMLNIVRLGSDNLELKGTNSMSVQIFVYKSLDLISENIRGSHTWEPEMVQSTLRFALKVPHATFLDIGSNIGVYSIQAAKLGLPVVSLDANIRNLLRLRLTLNAASLDADLVWNFIAPGEQLRYLSFLADCNVGGASKNKLDLLDTIPVMPLRSERITSLIKTKNVVMKMDLEGGEADFLQMSGRLFTDFNVAAVQMEWWNSRISDPVAMEKFFSSRGYKVWRTPGLQSLNQTDVKNWGDIDVMWVHKDYVSLM